MRADGMALKTGNSVWWSAASLLIAVCLTYPAAGGPLQLISAADAAQGAPAGGSSDSGTPILSPDGRFVLFASTANNLVLNNASNPIPLLLPPRINVYLRDRTNGTTVLVSVNASGDGGGNGDSLPAGLSADGRWVLFESSADDLVAGDTNNLRDVFIRDMIGGTTMLVSVGTNGLPANGVSRGSVMTPNGRYIAFVSAASNLVTNDTNGIPDVFVRDLQNGTTVLASVGAMPTNTSASASSSESPDLTPDGRYVAFYSTATNLVSGVMSAGDLYVRDLTGGTTYWASSGARNAVQSVLGTANASAFNHVLSSNGQFLAYEASPNPVASLPRMGVVLRYSLQSGLTDVVHTNAVVPGGPFDTIQSLDMTPDGRFIAFVANTNTGVGTAMCVEVWDAQSGGLTLVSADRSNNIPTNAFCAWPTLDLTGQFVAFLSRGANLVTNILTGDYHLYVRDMFAANTMLVDAATNATGALVSPAAAPRMSADGRFVAFECRDGNLVANDRNRSFDVFVRDLAAGATELISAHDAALSSLTPNGSSVFSTFAVSADGSRIAFASEADNLAPGDTNGCRDVFVRDAVGGTTFVVSVSTNGVSTGDGVSTDPAISADGRYVVFASSADNLVAGDTNNARDIFLRDLQAGTTTLVSINTNGTGPGSGDSYSPIISTNGRYVLFRSRAVNLARGSVSSSTTANLLWRDLVAGTTLTVTNNFIEPTGEPTATMTPDGRFVAFQPQALYGGVYVWDSASTRIVYSLSTAGCVALAISSDGQRLAYMAANNIYAANRAPKTNWLVVPAYPIAHAAVQFSADGRWLTYAAAAALNNPSQVWRYDFQTGTNALVSRNYLSGAAANANSDSPALSPDGRFIAYRSAATDLVPNANSGIPNLVLFDSVTGANTLLTRSRFSNSASDNRCIAGVFSADGQRLIFQSWASDLVSQDFNASGDLFGYPFLYASIVPSNSPGQGPTITWPAVAGTAYRVQIKNALGDLNWQDNTNVTIVGNKGYFADPSPAAGQRLYRVVAY